jgi:predicted O-methyltransferase YrrM
MAMGSSKTSFMDRIIKGITALLKYTARSPRWGMSVIRSMLFEWENAFHQRCVHEYAAHTVPLNKALALSLHVDSSIVSSVLGTALLKRVANETKTRLHRVNGINPIPDSGADVSLAEACYVTCRLLKPATVVETGVARGITSAFILHALDENKKGQLYSVDLPVPLRNADLFTGIAVPKRLRDRWTLILDDSLHALHGLIRKVGQIDLFVHDSDHSYRHQMIEYRLAWNSLRLGGVLISDDVNRSEAFLKFAEMQKSQPLIVKQLRRVVSQSTKSGSIGILGKPLVTSSNLTPNFV